MANILKLVLRTNIYGTELWVTDKSGAYSVNNLGGWGTPNKLLADSAVLVFARKESVGDITYLEPITNQIVHNPAAADTVANNFGFKYEGDGHYYATIALLPVSDNAGLSDLEGNEIAEGVYYVQDLELYIKEEGVGVLIPVEDYADLLEDDAVIKTTCEAMFYNQSHIKARDYYKLFKDNRNAHCGYDEYLNKYNELRADIAGAEYSFRSGLKLEAESQVKTFLKTYEVE